MVIERNRKRSYTVITENGYFRRNRRDLRATSETFNILPADRDVEVAAPLVTQSAPVMESEQVLTSPEPVVATSRPETMTTSPAMRRSSRIKRKPDRYEAKF